MSFENAFSFSVGLAENSFRFAFSFSVGLAENSFRFSILIIRCEISNIAKIANTKCDVLIGSFLLFSYNVSQQDSFFVFKIGMVNVF